MFKGDKKSPTRLYKKAYMGLHDLELAVQKVGVPE